MTEAREIPLPTPSNPAGVGTSRPRGTALSIVIPVRDEQENVAPLHGELSVALGSRDYEIVFVNDGSQDGTAEVLRDLKRRDPRVRVLHMEGPRGKASAYQAGFRAARGAIVATMDGDLQDDPADLLSLVERAEAGFADLVVGWKQGGKSSKTTFVLSRLFNGMLRLFVKPRLHDMNCPLRAMRSDVAMALDLGADLHRYIPLLAASKGFLVKEIPVRNRPRQHGVSKYRGTKYWTSAVSLVGVLLYLRFGRRPMALFGGIGLLSLVLGIAIDAWFALRYVVSGQSIDDDFPTIVLGVLLILIGTQFLSLGLLGEIVVRQVGRAMDVQNAQAREES